MTAPVCLSWYLAHGWPVFPLHSPDADGRCSCGKDPCGSAGKHPRIVEGFKAATLDPATVAAWWDRWPDANVGIPTGPPIGAWVLDVDPRHGGDSVLARLEVEHGSLPPTLTARTGSGGLHLFWRYPTDREVRNSTGGTRTPGLDVRGAGGFVVASPSLHASGGRYAWETLTADGVPDLSMLADAPAWLLEALQPARPTPDRERTTWTPTSRPPGEAHPYAVRALENACRRVACTPEGSRNDALHREAYTVGGFVGAGYLVRSDALADLVAAGEAAGLPHEEAADVAGRGLDAGALAPTPVPEPERRPPPPRSGDLHEEAPPPWDPDDPGPDDPGDPVEDAIPDPAHEEGSGPEGPTPKEAAAIVARVSLAAAADLLLELYSTEKPAYRFRWPGEEPDTVDGLPLARIPAAALELRPAGALPRWGTLARKVGPLQPDRLAVLVGKPKSGKSALALQAAEGQARAREAPVLYVSAEMGAPDLVARLVALRARGDDRNYRNGVPYSDILEGRADPEALLEALGTLVADYPRLYLWAPGAQDRTPDALERMAAAVSVACDGLPPLVILDYLQRFTSIGDGPLSAEKRLAVSDTSRRLRDLARPGSLGPTWPGAAVLALSSTARTNYRPFRDTRHLWAAAYGGFVPGPGKAREESTWQDPMDLEGMGKESGEIEYDASLLLDLATDLPEEGRGAEPRHSLLVVGASRYRGSGEHVRLSFLPACGTFREEEWPLPEGWRATLKASPAGDGGRHRGRGSRGADRAAGDTSTSPPGWVR